MIRDFRLVGWFGWFVPLAVTILLPLLGAGCPTARDLPPRTEDQTPPRQTEDKQADVPFCGKVFSDPKTGKRGACCRAPPPGSSKAPT